MTNYYFNTSGLRSALFFFSPGFLQIFTDNNADFAGITFAQ